MSEPDAPPDPESLKIMVATDSHLGYMERDPVRGKDSFAAFEEMLLLAKQQKVDFVLLGGDLFHENKPSRRTLYRTMDILRRHCMGDEPVSFQIVSEQAHNFKDRFGHVNYEDPYFSVGLPIFSIHGNHDDPTREGGVEALAALDLLHVANLVNYFGKSDKVDDVEVNPILIQKGLTKLALYGLGSMRDERLNRMWQQKKVRFLRPLEDEADGGKDFFNVFVLHQNRDLGRGKKNCIPESMIPEWIDLVIWGHEHESLVEPVESLVGFRICQPGSSVATSLCEGEAVPKHVGLLEIRGNDFRIQSLPLTQVRPFRMGEIVLNEVEGLDSKGVDVDEAVGEALARQVELMVKELHEEDEESNKEPPAGQEYLIEKRDQVLVRLRVEHSDFPTLNNQRFGSQFMGKVANPSDLLLFYRRRNMGGGGAAGGSSAAGGLSDPIRPDNLADLRVEDLVMENLENSDKKLCLLLEPKLKMALEDYVHKQDAQAMNDLVKDTLEGAQRALRKEKSAGNAAMIDDAVSKMSEKERGKLEAERLRNEEQARSRAKRNARVPAAGRAGDRAPNGNGVDEGRNGVAPSDDDDDLDDEDDDADMGMAPPARTPVRGGRRGGGGGGGGGSGSGGGSGRAAGRGRGTIAAAFSAGAAASGRRGSAAAAAAAAAAAVGSGDDEDEDEDGDDGDDVREEEEEEEEVPAAKRGGGGGRGRSAASQAAAIDLADDSEDDVFDNASSSKRSTKKPNKRGGAGAGGGGAGAASGRARGSRSTPATSTPRKRGSEKSSTAAAAGRRASARGGGRARVSYLEDEEDDSSEVEEVAPTRGGRGGGRVRGGGGGGGGGVNSDSLTPLEIDDDDEEEDYMQDEDDEGSEFDMEEEEAVVKRKGRNAKGKAAAAGPSRSARSTRTAPAARGKGAASSRGAAATAAASSSRSKKRPAAAAAADSQLSEASSAGGAKKRRLPTWAGSSAGGGRRRRDDDDDEDDVSSAVSGWGEMR